MAAAATVRCEEHCSGGRIACRHPPRARSWSAASSLSARLGLGRPRLCLGRAGLGLGQLGFDVAGRLGALVLGSEDDDGPDHRDRERQRHHDEEADAFAAGKVGAVARGISSAVTSEKAMKTAAVPARPSFWSSARGARREPTAAGASACATCQPSYGSSVIALPPPRRTGSAWHAAAREELDAGRGADLASVHEVVAATLECHTLRGRQERGLRAGVESVPLARARVGDRLRKRHAEIDAIEHLSTVVMIVAPPGEPSARKGRPPLVTIVGAIELLGRLPPSTRFGCVVESKLKSVNSLLSRNPWPGTTSPRAAGRFDRERVRDDGSGLVRRRQMGGRLPALERIRIPGRDCPGRRGRRDQRAPGRRVLVRAAR